MIREIKWRLNWFFGLVVAAVIILCLGGCGAVEGNAGVSYEVVTVQYDGRTVPCVVVSGGGVHCDWGR